MDLIRPFLLTFIPLFVAIDAFGILPIFISLTANLPKQERDRAFRQAILAAGLIGVGFMLLGNAIFLYLGITGADFQIAGGAMLFCLSLTDLLFEDRTRRFPSHALGVVPLAMPLIVGPAVLTTSIALLNVHGFWLTLAAFLVNLGIVWLALWGSEWIMATVGGGALNVIAKVVNLLLAAIGVMMVRRGLQAFLGHS
ncbi:MAG: MarC family protein [candidate division NC10 bacterium]|nr:MarC family protein [candidate division NC10 bacterium]